MAGFEVSNRDIPTVTKIILQELEQSVAYEKSVEIEYRSKREDQLGLRVIDPYGIFYWNNKWYVIGFCHLRNEIRSFRVERIIQIKQTNMMFKRPEDFSAKSHFLQSILPDFDNNTIVPLIIQGREEALDDLCLHWFLGHYLKERTPNQAVFLMDEELMQAQVPYFLFSYGKSLQVIEPQSIKKRLVIVASELTEYYQSQ